MKSLLRRSFAATATGALVAGTLSALALAPAQAASYSGDLTWNVSANFAAWDTKTLAGGAAEAGSAFTFPVESVSTSAGSTTTEFAGSVKAGRGTMYAVTVADPKLVVDADGSGELRATVSSEMNYGGSDSSAPTEVTVVEFDASSTTDGVFKATPNYAGVITPGSDEATAAGITKAGQPLEGKSFNKAFVGALISSVKSHFYASGAAGDVNKAPGEISANVVAAAPAVTATVTAQSAASGVTVKVEGRNFSANGIGVYAILAPADSKIDFSNSAEAKKYKNTQWVMPQQFVGDSFTTVISAATAELVKGKSYAIFTTAAHGATDRTQDTVTPVALDWKLLSPVVKKSSKTTLKVTKKATTKKTGKVSLSVAGGKTKATGKVTVSVKAPGKKTVKKSVTLKNGKATVALTKAKKKGTYKVAVTYKGDKSLKAAKKVTKTFKVKK